MSELPKGEAFDAGFDGSPEIGAATDLAQALTQAALNSQKTEAFVSAAGRALSQSPLRVERLFVSMRALHPAFRARTYLWRHDDGSCPHARMAAWPRKPSGLLQLAGPSRPSHQLRAAGPATRRGSRAGMRSLRDASGAGLHRLFDRAASPRRPPDQHAVDRYQGSRMASGTAISIGSVKLRRCSPLSWSDTPPSSRSTLSWTPISAAASAEQILRRTDPGRGRRS